MKTINARLHPHVFMVLKAIPHDMHRYPTIGDYWRNADGSDQVRVSQFKDVRHEWLVLIHELVEYFLCLHRGISEFDIKQFDLDHLDSDDPGNIPAAPYHKEHVFAECIERLFAQQLEVNWQDYETACLALECLHGEAQQESLPLNQAGG